MKNTSLTKQERSLVAIMRIWMVTFLVAGVVFAAAPSYVPTYLTNIGTVLFGWQPWPEATQTSYFWLVLAVTLLFTLSYICAIVQHNVARHVGYTTLVILSIFFSTIGYCICFFLEGRHFAYLVGAIVDGSIFLVTWYLYTKAFKSRT